MTTPRGNITWEHVKKVIDKIQEINPVFSDENYIIGGSGAWFYRRLLEKENDTDFPCPAYTAEEEINWLSKDVDFIGTTKNEDYPIELQTPATGTPPKVYIENIWVDSPDVGLYITKQRAQKTAVEITNPKTRSSYKVASPILLYREKKELLKTKKPNRPQDTLHAKTLKTASKLLICKLGELAPTNKKMATLLFKLLKEAQEIAPEILADKTLLKRLEELNSKFQKQPETKALWNLLNQQILNQAPNIN